MHKYVMEKVKQGKLAIDKINTAVERVLKFKFKYCMDIPPIKKTKKF